MPQTKSVDPDQTLHIAASDLGLHCLQMCLSMPLNCFLQTVLLADL